jgi:hypothetical protein
MCSSCYAVLAAILAVLKRRATLSAYFQLLPQLESVNSARVLNLLDLTSAMIFAQ